MSVFDGYTVVELADRRNQFVGKVMSDAGARVIQIEPTSGSPGRWCGPFVDDREDPDRCLDYWYYNTGKESVAVDIQRAPGRELVRQLVANADVFIESTRPGSLKVLGLDYETLSRENPRLVYLSLTDFGQSGPWVDLEMNDFAHLALGGQMASTGYSDLTETPIGGQGRQAWNMASVMAMHGVTVALHEVLASGLGQQVDVSIHECCAVETERAVSYWMWYDEPFMRQTGQHAAPRNRPDTQILAADGRYVMTAGARLNTHAWVNLVEWMKEVGVAGELVDEKFRDDFVRATEMREGTAVREGYNRLISKVPSEEAFRRAQAIGLPWAVVRAPEENYDLEHYRVRNYWAPIEQPEAGKTVRYPRGFFNSEVLGVKPRRRAPHLGEHTTSVLTNDLALTDEDVATLTGTGVVK